MFTPVYSVAKHITAPLSATGGTNTVILWSQCTLSVLRLRCRLPSRALALLASIIVPSYNKRSLSLSYIYCLGRRRRIPPVVARRKRQRTCLADVSAVTAAACAGARSQTYLLCGGYARDIYSYALPVGPQAIGAAASAFPAPPVGPQAIGAAASDFPASPLASPAIGTFDSLRPAPRPSRQRYGGLALGGGSGGRRRRRRRRRRRTRQRRRLRRRRRRRRISSSSCSLLQRMKSAPPTQIRLRCALLSLLPMLRQCRWFHRLHHRSSFRRRLYRLPRLANNNAKRRSCKKTAR